MIRKAGISEVGSTVDVTITVDTAEEAQALVDLVNSMKAFAEVSNPEAVKRFFSTDG